MKALSQVSDVDLISNFRDLLIDEREGLVKQLEYLVELDRTPCFTKNPTGNIAGEPTHTG